MDIDFKDQLDWDEAIKLGGFYFERARYLGLPKPPRCIVIKDDSELNYHELMIMGRYHQLFKEAEEDQASRLI